MVQANISNRPAARLWLPVTQVSDNTLCDRVSWSQTTYLTLTGANFLSDPYYLLLWNEYKNLYLPHMILGILKVGGAYCA